MTASHASRTFSPTLYSYKPRSVGNEPCPFLFLRGNVRERVCIQGEAAPGVMAMCSYRRARRTTWLPAEPLQSVSAIFVWFSFFERQEGIAVVLGMVCAAVRCTVQHVGRCCAWRRRCAACVGE